MSSSNGKSHSLTEGGQGGSHSSREDTIHRQGREDTVHQEKEEAVH